jgi:hypothetical protein
MAQAAHAARVQVVLINPPHQALGDTGGRMADAASSHVAEVSREDGVGSAQRWVARGPGYGLFFNTSGTCTQ